MRRLERYVSAGTRRLRVGYTTGTCAAAATAAATELLCSGHAPLSVTVETPAGVPVTVDIESAHATDTWASCSTIKDAGDDADVTDGIEVVARVTRADQAGIRIEGGEGVGRVTLPGLDQGVGEPAINSVPRRMCEQAAREAAERAGYAGGLVVELSIPGGAELAQRTFNPRLGITGGLSILGTTGLVRPQSAEALADAIRVELSVVRASGVTDLVLVPGAYGETYCRDVLRLTGPIVSCANFVGDAIDEATRLGCETLLFVGHIGKLAKVATGAFNTHSRIADGRAEALCTHAALAGADRATLTRIMDAATCDAMLAVLAEQGLAEATCASLGARLHEQLTRRAGEGLRVEAIVFSHAYGELVRTPGASELVCRHLPPHPKEER